MTDRELENQRVEAEVTRDRQPLDRARIEQLLTQYFVGPITAEHVDRLMTTFERDGDEQWSADQADFESLVKWQGYAWKEEVSENRRSMAPIDQLLLMGHCMFLNFKHMGGQPFPEPKLYCPETFVGVWEQESPRTASPVFWYFNRDGTFQSNSPDLPGQYPRWCILREYGLKIPTFTLTFRTDLSDAAWVLYGMTATPRELVGHAWDKREFRLRRRT